MSQGTLELVRLVDMDDRSKQEVSDALSLRMRVQSRRNLESYVFDDDILRALAERNDQLGKAHCAYRREETDRCCCMRHRSTR